MYRVTVITDGIEYPLHEPRDSDGELQLIDPVVTLEMGKNGSFTFRISPLHPNKDKIQALRSEITVYDNEEILFAGRPIGDESDFYSIGKATCEGELAYLLDSIQRPYKFTGSGAAFLRQVLEVHNSQVEERKRFEVGNITVPDIAPEIQRSNTSCANSLETLKTQLVAVNGGYLRVRRAGGKKYLDYVIDYGGINSQTIRFGENLLDLTRYVKPTSIITALIPYGATLESDNTEEEEKPIDITIVNDGKDYIYDQDAVNVYGWIWGTQTFDDLADPEALLSRARAYLTECVALPVTLELTAVDLGLIDVDVQKLKVGYWTQVESVPHKISRRFMLSKKVIHLDNPGKDEVILGQTLPSFTGVVSRGQMEISDRIKRVAASASREINRKVENATQLITGGKGGYVVLDVDDPDTGKRSLPWRILIMDTPDKETATSVIQLNKNGIGFSRTGINGPYDNAWTIDGNLVADFITTGTMLADRIRGGILEVGGAGLARDGSITVKNAQGEIIGTWDKTGLHVYLGEISGTDIVGGTINIGNGVFVVDADGSISIGDLFYADDGVVQFGDYRVSANGTNELVAVNNWVKINTNERPSGSPGGGYASLFLGGDGYHGITLHGTGEISCSGIECDDVFASSCHLAHGSYLWGLGATIDWFWEQFEDLRDKVDNL